MTSVLKIIPRAPVVAQTIGIVPSDNPGTLEVIDGINNRFIRAQAKTMSSEYLAAGLRNTYDYWAFLIGLINDYAPAHITPLKMGMDPIYAAAIGGIDLALLSKENPNIYWKSEAARAATLLMIRASTLSSPQAFAAAGHDTRFITLITTYADLCTQMALLSAQPEIQKHEPLHKMGGVGIAEKLDFYAHPSKLVKVIADTEATVIQMWRDLQPKARQTGTQRFTIVQ